MQTSPLAGLRVVDLTIWVQGPLAGQLLADLGADVIKIEKPGQGDFARGLMSLYGADMQTKRGHGLLYEVANRNKRSIAVDLRKDEGQRLIHRMLGTADIFVTNLQPSTLNQFGLAPERVRKLKPDLVYALGTGLGRHGILADLPAQDTTATAFAGFMYTASRDDEPYYPPGALADVISGTNLAFGILAALRLRDKTGEGQFVSTSLVHGMMWLQQLSLSTIANLGNHLKRFDPATARNPFMNLYKCSDGEWIALGFAVMNREGWLGFCEVVGMPELSTDERYARNRDRIARSQEMVELLTCVFIRKSRDAWVTAFRDASLPAAPVRRLDELLADDAVRADGILGDTVLGTTFVRPPFTLDGYQPPTGDAPDYAQDTFSVLTDLGLSPEEVARLHQDEVVW
jgi:crotonobetainyl-CoA:carnitine CoA-transferase CaiB-like acyl-CoA transferase